MLLFLIIAVIMALASAQCPSGAHIVVARGSEEPQGPGVLGPIAQRIQNIVPGSDVDFLVYPALFEPYNPSQMAGVAAMTQLVGDFTHQCPDTKVIILGYSQVCLSYIHLPMIPSNTVIGCSCHSGHLLRCQLRRFP